MCTIDLFTTVLSFSTWEVYFNPDDLLSPLIKGFPFMNEMKTILLQCILSDYLPWYYRSLP